VVVGFAQNARFSLLRARQNALFVDNPNLTRVLEVIFGFCFWEFFRFLKHFSILICFWEKILCFLENGKIVEVANEDIVFCGIYLRFFGIHLRIFLIRYLRSESRFYSV